MIIALVAAQRANELGTRSSSSFIANFEHIKIIPGSGLGIFLQTNLLVKDTRKRSLTVTNVISSHSRVGDVACP
jgi:hypothetical protein